MLAIAAPLIPFWIIWNPNGPHAPKVRFSTAEAAETEAKRLAAFKPGHEFFVMQMVGKATMPPPTEVTYVRAGDAVQKKPASTPSDYFENLRRQVEEADRARNPHDYDKNGNRIWQQPYWHLHEGVSTLL